MGDVGALPTNIKKQFSISNNSQEVIVFSAEINSEEAVPVPPHALELQWCTKDEARDLNDLAFEHVMILKKYLSARDASK